MAHLREASGWTDGAPEARMRLYLLGEHHPQKALASRVAYVAEAAGAIVGFIAGHLTARFGCEGELQWPVALTRVRRDPFGCAGAARSYRGGRRIQPCASSDGSTPVSSS